MLALYASGPGQAILRALGRKAKSAQEQLAPSCHRLEVDAKASDYAKASKPERAGKILTVNENAFG